MEDREDNRDDHLVLDQIGITIPVAAVAILTTSKKIIETFMGQIQMIPTKGAQGHRQITLQKITAKKGQKTKSEDQ